MNVNYIKHLAYILEKFSEDNRLNATHISLYMSLFHQWNKNRFQNPISINRSEVMKISKIGSQGTYHRCINDLSSWSYFKYQPSKNPLKGSIIYMFNFETSSRQVQEQVEAQLLIQVSEPSINNIKHNKHINITNKEVDDLKIVSSKEPKILKRSSSGAEMPPLKEEKAIKLSKTEARTGSSNSRGTTIDLPSLEQVKEFFKEKNKTDLDAEKFFNHFESNGWLVGGKSKMKNWQAAARNWISRSEEYNKLSLSSSKSKPIDRLNTVQNKDYTIPL